MSYLGLKAWQGGRMLQQLHWSEIDELLYEGSLKHNIPPTFKDRHELSPLCKWDIHAYTIGIFLST
jgi:hypothetical protein